MWSFARFYWSCLQRAFPRAWAWAWITSSALAIVGGSVAVFWAPFGTAINILVGLLPLATFVGIMIGGPLVAAFRINRELQDENADLKTLLADKRSEDEIKRERRQKLEKQLGTLKPEEKEFVRQLLVKGRMLPHQVPECSIEKNLPHVDLNVLKVKTSFLQRDADTGSWSIDRSFHDLLKEVLVDG